MGQRSSATPLKPPAATEPARVLGEAVRRQRKLLGLTQAGLARHAGVGLAFLYQLENGKRTVRLDKVLAVLEVLGVSLTLALGRPGAPAGTVRSELPEPAA